MDSVFPTDFPLLLNCQPERITGPGIGDNALGLAGLLNLTPILRSLDICLPGDLWVAGTVCEEGLGNLRGIQQVTEKFGAEPAAYLSIEGLGLGNVLHRGLGVERYRIRFQTAGGHSWVDYGDPSAVHELVKLAGQLLKIRIPKRPRTSLNIGIIQGGTSINTIAADAHIDLDLRSESATHLVDINARVKQLIKSYGKRDITVEMERIGWRPAGELPENHPLVKTACSVLSNIGIKPHLDIASTEANYPLSLNYPALTIGLTTGDKAHSAQEFINTPMIMKGMMQLVDLVSRAWETV